MTVPSVPYADNPPGWGDGTYGFDLCADADLFFYLLSHREPDMTNEEVLALIDAWHLSHLVPAAPPSVVDSAVASGVTATPTWVVPAGVQLGDVLLFCVSSVAASDFTNIPGQFVTMTGKDNSGIWKTGSGSSIDVQWLGSRDFAVYGVIVTDTAIAGDTFTVSTSVAAAWSTGLAVVRGGKTLQYADFLRASLQAGLPLRTSLTPTPTGADLIVAFVTNPLGASNVAIAGGTTIADTTGGAPLSVRTVQGQGNGGQLVLTATASALTEAAFLILRGTPAGLQIPGGPLLPAA